MNPREACASCAPTKYKALLIAFDAQGQRIKELEEREIDLLAELDSYRSQLVNEALSSEEQTSD
jgi:hypothetical protein